MHFQNLVVDILKKTAYNIYTDMDLLHEVHLYLG